MRLLTLCMMTALVALGACQKEVNEDLNSGPGGGGGGGLNASCNNTVMQIKRRTATFDTAQYVEAAWNTDGTIHSIKINEQLTDYRNITFTYSGGKIVEGILRNNDDHSLVDTIVFHYNADGKVDSMYYKNDNWFTLKLTYSSGKLVKLTRLANGGIMYYWDLVMDAHNNIVKGEEYWEDNGSYVKESTFTYSRDDRKNPFKDLAVYMLYLDDEYGIYRFWGPNNLIDQRYIDHTGLGIDLTTGKKYTYNNNCYPAGGQNTIMGQTLFTDDDFIYTYY